MSDAPDGIVLERHRDLDGLRKTLWPRRLILGAVAAFALLGLANVFGQRPVNASANAPEASLTVNAPADLRGGLLFSARFHLSAHRDLKDAVLVLDQGWAEGIGINTIEPSPIGQASRDGKLSLDLGHVAAGRSYVLYMQFQANATNVAWRRPAGVTLFDGAKRLLHIDRKVTVFP